MNTNRRFYDIVLLLEKDHFDMAHLLRGKQAGIHGDLSASIGPESFGIDDVGVLSLPTRYFIVGLSLLDQSFRYKLSNLGSSI